MFVCVGEVAIKEPEDLIAKFTGRLWECEIPEAKLLLRAMSDLSVAQHNMNHSRDAIKVSMCQLCSTLI